MDASAEDDFDCVRACTYVEEAEELAAIVCRVVASRGAEAALVYQRFHQIVSCPMLTVLMQVLTRRQRPSQVIARSLCRRRKQSFVCKVDHMKQVLSMLSQGRATWLPAARSLCAGSC